MDCEFSDPVLQGPKTIKMRKPIGPRPSDTRTLSFKTIDAALISLRGDVWVSECLLVVTPEKDTMDTSLNFEIHGIDKIYKQFLGTILLSREDLKILHEKGQFENYSMIFVRTAVDPCSCMEFLVSHCGDPDEFGTGNSMSTRRKKRKRLYGNPDSEPTIHELLLRLKGSYRNQSDLTKFFDLAEDFHFSITVRPDFVNCSNKLILDCFIFKTDYVGSLCLTIREISEQMEQHSGLIRDLVMVEDTNELLMPTKVASFIRRVASAIKMLYVYDYISEFIYKIVHDI